MKRRAPKQYVLPGSCHVGQQIQKCALHKKQCYGGSSIFLSGRKTRNIGQDCTGVEQFVGGRCRDTGFCAPEYKVCASKHFFAPTDECTLINDHLKNKLTPYGRCSNPDNGHTFCAWNERECKGRYQFEKVTEECDCTKVKTGACQYKDEIVCAIAAHACDEMGVFKSAIELIEESIVDCRLCQVPIHVDISNTSMIEGEVIDQETLRADDSPIAVVTISICILVAAMLAILSYSHSRLSRSIKRQRHAPSIEFSDDVE